MPVDITYREDKGSKLTSLEVDENFRQLADAIDSGGLSSDLANGKVYIGNSLNQAEQQTLNKSLVGLSNVDNTSDLNKPISTDTQNALDDKLDLSGSNANQDIDIGNYALNGKRFKVNGTAGNGNIGLKHQSSNATASASETAIFAGSDGELYYKNDGNAVAQIASRAWVSAQGFITNVITALGYTPENVANKENTILDTSTTKYPTNNLVKTYADNLGNTLTTAINGRMLPANNLSDVANVATSRTNLQLGSANDVTFNSVTGSNATVSTLAFFDSAKKLVSATGALLGTWFQTLTSKSTPVDADTFVVNDSTASFEAKKTTLAQLFTYISTKIGLGSLTTNNTLKWNGTNIVNANETDNGTTITSTLNRVFTGASANSNGTGANSNKFLFDGNNTSSSSSGSHIQIAPQMQVTSASIGGSLRGILYLDGSANSYANNGFTQLYLNSGGDLIGSKISLSRAIYINHSSADQVNNANVNTSAISINATMFRPQISAVGRSGAGIHHITSVNADNYSSIIQDGASGSNPINYSAYSQRSNAIGFSHVKDVTASSGIQARHNVNGLNTTQTTWSNGFGFSNINTLANNNASPQIVNLNEEYIIQNQGAGTVYAGKRYRHENVNQGSASAYIMGLYPTGVIIGDTTALPNSAAQLDLQSTTKGLGLNIITTRPTGRKYNLFANDNNTVLEYSDTTGSSFKELAVYKFDELLQINDCNATFATANTGVYFPFTPKCDMNVSKIYYNLQSAGTDTVRVAIYSDSSNQATTLLVQSNEATTGSTTTGQRSITISTTRLLAQTRYWIAIKNDNGASSFLSKNDVYNNNITRESFTSGAFVTTPTPSSSTNAVWLGIGI